jgi:antirestriction protein ArdC
MSDMYQEVTDQIVKALEQGVAPWVRPWSEEADPIPLNVVSDRPYRGANVLLLNLKSLFAGYSRNRWLTYRQAVDLGGQVRAGETGVRILYYKLRKVPARVEVFPWKSDPDEIDEKVVPLLRSYTVFNIEQVKGLPKPPDPGGWSFDSVPPPSCTTRPTCASGRGRPSSRAWSPMSPTVRIRGDP